MQLADVLLDALGIGLLILHARVVARLRCRISPHFRRQVNAVPLAPLVSQCRYQTRRPACAAANSSTVCSGLSGRCGSDNRSHTGRLLTSS
jgi:hypothetical protein